MTILEQIKSKTTIDVDNMLVERLCRELNLSNEELLIESKEQLLYDIYDVVMIILDNTNLYKVPKEMYATVINMVKDYWFLNKHNILFLTDEEKQKMEAEQMKVKSISIGDTATTFSDKQSQININGTTYNTGTIDFNKNILIEKCKQDFYNHRQPRWD